MNRSARAYELAGQEKFSEALQELKAIEQATGLSPDLLVLKSDCIQLSDGNDGYELSDAKRSLEAALAIDRNHLDAAMELGYFHYAIEDDAQQAKPHFYRALELAEYTLLSILKGMAGCIEETECSEAAEEYLNEWKNSPLSDGIAEIIADVDGVQ